MFLCGSTGLHITTLSYVEPVGGPVPDPPLVSGVGTPLNHAGMTGVG